MQRAAITTNDGFGTVPRSVAMNRSRTGTMSFIGSAMIAAERFATGGEIAVQRGRPLLDLLAFQICR